MPTAILFTEKTKMLVAQQTEQPIEDVEAMLDVARAAEKNHGPCYVVLDYVAPEDGRTVPWASMHIQYFDANFEFNGINFDKKFVPVNPRSTN